jgi:hypothetical protein
MKFRVEKKRTDPEAREGEREREQKPRARGERVEKVLSESALRSTHCVRRS